MTDSPAEPTPRELTLEARVEALLFVSPSRVSISQLAQILETSPREIELALEQLESTYASRGIRLQRSNRSIQLTTAPELANDVERFLGLEETTSLSSACNHRLPAAGYTTPDRFDPRRKF